MDARRRPVRALALAATFVIACWAPPALAQAPIEISGTVTDASGHGWPLAAEVQVGGQTVRTDPVTGHFTVELASGVAHDLTVSAPGHQTVQRTVTVPPDDPVQDFALPVAATCAAPGYTANTGPALLEQPFATTSTPAGWTVTAGPNGSWRFDDPSGRGNLTGASGSFAIIDSDSFGIGNSQDTSLVAPSIDLSGAALPELRFNSDYRSLPNASTVDVDVSTDGGGVWRTLMSAANDSRRGPRVETVPLPAGDPSVIVRFRFRGTWAWWWQVDDVRVVDRCAHVAGGIVAGTVTDRASGRPIAGAVVTGPQDSTAPQAPTATTAADGSYRMLVTQTGSRSLSASAAGFVTAARNAGVVPDAAVRRDFELDAVPAPVPIAAQQTEPEVTAWTVAGSAVVATRADGSVRTLLTGTPAIDGLATDGADLILSFAKPARLGGVRFDDSDLVRYSGGAFSLWLDGGDVGLTRAGENVDAVERLPDGRILLSTSGASRLGALRAQDEDVLAFTPRALGARTAGRWRLYLDGGDVGLTAASEDVDGLAVDATGAIGLSVRGRLGVPALHAGAGDVATFVPSRLGRRTVGRFAPGLMLTGTAGDFDVR